MTKKLLVFLVALSVLGFTNVWAKASKEPKVVETRINEADMGKLATSINKAVKEAVIAKQGPAGFEYMAKKMKPPKNEKWIDKWNELGTEGWEYVDHFENIYIFKRVAMSASSGARVKPAAAPAKAEPVADDKAEKKAAKEQEKADKKAQKEQEKAAKKVEKDQKKADKKAAKEAKKAEKEKAKKSE